MSDPSKPEVLEELLLLAQSGEATQHQIEELNEMLRGSDELRAVAVRHLQMDAMLHDEHHAREAAAFFDGAKDGRVDPAENQSARSNLWIQNLSRSRLLFVVAASTIGFAVALSALIHLTNRAAVQLAKENESSFEGLEVQEAKPIPQLVATVTFEKDARWQRNIVVGSQIEVGELSLLSGIARLHTIHGVVMILDARNQPVRIALDADQSVTVQEGTVLAKASEQALGFALRTPSTTVIDIGTEFAVSVDQQGRSDVSVLDGAVTCLPAERPPLEDRSMVSAGQSVRFRGPTDQTGRELDGVSSSYDELLSIIESAENSSVDGRLIAEERFEYPVGSMTDIGGGFGWEAPWFQHSVPSEAPRGVIRRGQHLLPPAWLHLDNDFYTVSSLASASVRKLSVPIDLSEDREWFISFLMRKSRIGVVGDDFSGAGLALYRADGTTQALGMSLDMRDNLTMYTGGERYRSQISLVGDDPYFYVLKLKLSKDEPDEIFVKVFKSDDPPQVVEPETWDGEGVPFKLDGTIDDLRVWCGAAAIAAFDEIRVGESWNSVVPIRK